MQSLQIECKFSQETIIIDVDPLVDFIVAEDNEAVIKIVAKDFSAKLRHVARDHGVNLDWLYEFFRHKEVLAKNVSTDYQIVGLGATTTTKPDTWRRLTFMMGIKPVGACLSGDAAEITMKKARVELKSKDSAPTPLPDDAESSSSSDDDEHKEPLQDEALPDDHT